MRAAGHGPFWVSLVKQSEQALREFVSVVHREADEIVSLLDDDDEVRSAILDWSRTLRTRTDFFILLSANDETEPPPEFRYWNWESLDQVVSISNFSEPHAALVLQRIRVVCDKLDDLVDALQADQESPQLLRYLGYLVSDLGDLKRIIQRTFPSLDDLR